MAHPYNSVRQPIIERSRVGHITKGYASGGAVIAERARGGKVKHKGTNVTVNIAPSAGPQVSSPLTPGVGPVPMPPPAVRPPVIPPGAGMPPGASPMPPGGPIRSAGGRAGYAKGG